MNMTTSIFIRSYRGDRFWLDYCLRSLAKFARGFSEILVVLPKGDEPHFEGTDFRGARIVWWNDLPGDGYMGQQHCKMHADTLTDAEHIVFIDSDCFATCPVCPEDFTTRTVLYPHKPFQLIRHWQDVGEAQMWQAIAAKALGYDPLFEHMAAMPLVYDRRTIAECRNYLEATHGKTLGEYIQAQPNREFSEFNILGAFAHRFQPHLYDWRMADPAHDRFPRTIEQRWSWGGLTDEIKTHYEKILR